ncbi:hypothetical protein ACU63Y_05620 [Klebsiella aerogenes]
MSVDLLNPIDIRKDERNHLIEMLRTHIELMKKNNLTSNEMYHSLSLWIKRREVLVNEDASQ